MPMAVSIALGSALVPPLLLMWIIHAHDKHPEPRKVVWTTFALGMLTPIPVVMFALPAMLAAGDGGSPLVAGAFAAFVTAALPEELCKFLVLRFYAATHRHFDERMDGIVYGTIASLGFATSENVMYVMGGGVFVALMRALTAIPMHGFLGVIMGYYAGEARFEPNRRASLYFKAVALPVLFHGLYDFPFLSVQVMVQRGQDTEQYVVLILALVGMGLAVLAIMVAWGLVLLRRVRRQQHQVVLAEGVDEG
jgi:RsiW-degrading membrane proteinase PrsW (M82 family)